MRIVLLRWCTPQTPDSNPTSHLRIALFERLTARLPRPAARAPCRRAAGPQAAPPLRTGAAARPPAPAAPPPPPARPAGPRASPAAAARPWRLRRRWPRPPDRRRASAADEAAPRCSAAPCCLGARWLGPRGARLRRPQTPALVRHPAARPTRTATTARLPLISLHPTAPAQAAAPRRGASAH